MAKINLKYNLNSNGELTTIETKGIKNDNTITFKDKDVMVKIKIEENNLIINRNKQLSHKRHFPLKMIHERYCIKEIPAYNQSGRMMFQQDNK